MTSGRARLWPTILARMLFHGLLIAGLSAVPIGSFASDRLPSLVEILQDHFEKERGVGGDVYSLGALLERYFYTNRRRFQAAGLFQNTGRSVTWRDGDGHEFALSETGIAGAVWLNGEIAVKDYLTFRDSQNWVGPVSSFPAGRALAFRKVEAGLILFQHALVDQPLATLTLEPVGKSVHDALLRAALSDFREEWGDDSIEEKHLWVAPVDLNGDSTPKAMVGLEHFDFCGSTGCNLSLYARTGGDWKRLGAMKGNKLFSVIANRGGYSRVMSGHYVLRWSMRRGAYVLDCIDWRCRHLNPHMTEP